MSVLEITLDKFRPRPYQIPIIQAIRKGYRRAVVIMPRRAGKDLTCFAGIMVEQALKRVGIYWHMLPTFNQGRKVVWNGIDKNGNYILDYIPKELIQAKNSQEMKITLINGSIIQIVGSDNFDALVGSNPCGIVMSEYALTDPRTYQFIRPILNENDGWCIMISTPRGKNHLYTLWNMAQENRSSWFCYKLTVDDTKHISPEKIEQERQSGELSEDMIQQEYYCSFYAGIEGAFYTRYLDTMRLRGQITDVPWEPSFLVHTAWDLGMRDKTAIIFFQCVGTKIHIIDAHEASDLGLEAYVKILSQKPYTYGMHIAPHDIQVRELGTGISRIEKMRQLGVRFTVAPGPIKVSMADGIEAVRTTLPKMYIDEKNAALVVAALENYRKEYDAKNDTYRPNPVRNKYTHMADALRYACISLYLVKEGMTTEEIDEIKHEALYGAAKRSTRVDVAPYPIFHEDF